MSVTVETKAEARLKEINTLAKTKEVKKYLKLVAQKFEEEYKNRPMEAIAPPLSKEDAVIADRIEKTKHLLLVKGKEYVRNNDRLHNFRRAAEMQRSNMPRVLHGMVQKHLVSYYDMLDDIDNGKKIDLSVVDEKIGDIIVYMHLQEVAIKENHVNYPMTDKSGC